MSLAGFLPATPASELPQTHSLERTATDFSTRDLTNMNKNLCLIKSVFRSYEFGNTTE